MPAIWASCKLQPSTNWANNQTNANGSRNDKTPIVMLARRLARSEAGSISAPARKVSTPLPSIARKFVHSGVFQRDQTAFHHLVQNRQERLNVFFAVHDLDDQRQIE